MVGGNEKMRDKIKDENYFKTLIEKEEKNIIMFENAVKKSIVEKGESDRGTRNGFSILINSYQNEINLLYSYGEDLEIIEEQYKKLLSYYGKMWDRKYGYIEMIKVLALAVLFEVDKGEIYSLEERIIYENLDDYLANILIGVIDSAWTKKGTEFEFKGVYDCLRPILDNKEDNSSELIKEYLQKKWYDIHKECTWYDSHRSSQNIYYGYWSFEAGAIAKILNIDDSNLKDEPYYPYDLVHYKN